MFPEELTDELTCEGISQRGEWKKTKQKHSSNQRSSMLKSCVLSENMVNMNGAEINQNSQIV